jgi:hypothetical protein
MSDAPNVPSLTPTELGDLAAAYGWWKAHGDPEMFYDSLNEVVRTRVTPPGVGE